MAEYQPSFLPEADLRAADLSWAYNRTPQADIPPAELQDWKRRILDFQQAVQAAPQAEQGSLFSAWEAPNPVDALDPFTLPQRNAEFWRGQFSESGVPALYFVVDHELPILLYVGETIKSNQRWKGEHDCKRYILNYIAAHRPHDLPVSVNIGFWPFAPCDRKARQSLESDLICRWRSPFNKENWTFWSTPFVGGKE
ncbi:GIY-YIG nuclease family protein [Pseudanabaena sp. FACHB-2040]|uniref:GIY-YIG nuclease family protein n=1 Tax=Pseudanabaena sp. FACHB-2040 TaxID=2692859 RepID=UPI0016894015|nr:GIY-YIG nuclease family protein [Pseudanabaena sp. FACHB-2040]MBD2257165.1 GIY-YIG nuclease family protein [Pseudanabaena sp. FACHB-2040]